MKKTIMALVGAALLGGCAMKEFSSSPLYSGNEVKFTGAVEDRVNLWPLAYWRAPVGSLAWPLISWGDDHLALRPFYSQYKQGGSGDYDEFNFLWPIAQFDTKHDDYRVFPFIWGKDYGNDPYFCLFPFLWWNDEFAGAFPFFWSRGGGGSGFCVFPIFWSEATESGSLWNTLWPLYYYESKETSDRDESEFWALCYLAGFERSGGKFLNHRLLPLYLWNDGDFYSLPYSRYRDSDTVKSRVLCGLAGCNSNTNGAYESSWLFPLYYHDKDEFVTPLFGKTADADWLIPLYYHDRESLLTPLFGMKGETHWTLPLYYKDETKFLTALGGRYEDAEWVLPLYWRDKDTFASLPYWRQLGADGEIDSAFSLPLLSGYVRDSQSGDRLLYVLLGLGGHVWNDETGGAGWMFPLYYRDSESFYTLLYGRNPRRRWLFPLYFDGEERTYITPLFGRNKKEGSEWLLPLYWRDEDSFVTPVFGRSGDSSWLVPLYFRSESGINTPVVSVWDDAKKGERGFFSLPLLSGATWATNSCERSWFALAGLVGGSSDATGADRWGWAFPLFIRNAGNSFYSLPYSWDGGGCATTNTYFAAGLAGVRSGQKEGGWLFPVFDKKKDADFDEKVAWLDRDTLPDDIRFSMRVVTNMEWNANLRKMEGVARDLVSAPSFYSQDTRSYFLFADNDRWLTCDIDWSDYLMDKRPLRRKREGEADPKKKRPADQASYEMQLRHERGNRLLFKQTGTRTVAFDSLTRRKTKDEESGAASFLMFLYQNERRADRVKGTSYASHRVLWKLWDWEEENGDVALDVFPGFTYDSKKDGYSKVSLLWRLFRYENDPKEGRKIDLLFIPVWR